MTLLIALTLAEKRERGWFPRQCAVEVLNDGFVDQPEADGYRGSVEDSFNTKKDR